MTIIDDIELVVGVDTHMDTHTAAICDSKGRKIAELSVPTSPAGYADLLMWVQDAAGTRRVVWAMESTRHYGLGLSRFLVSKDQHVAEIDNTRHIGKRRTGKSDPIDRASAR